MENTYKISLSIGDKSFTLESTDRSWLDRKAVELTELVSGKPQTALAATRRPQDHRAIPRTTMTIQEFYKKFVKPNKVTSRPDMAVHFVYYLTKLLSNKSVKTPDVEKCFADISYPGYNEFNFADILNQAKRKALLNKIDDNWSLTITGEDFVLSNISTEANG